MGVKLSATRVSLLVVVVPLVAAPYSNADPLVFEDHVLYPAGQMPSCVAAADLNGDTYADIVVANVLSADVSVLLNRQDGTFEDQVRLPAGGQARSIAIGDLNDDAYPDLAVGLQSGPHALAVFFNDGNGTFPGPVHSESGGHTAFTTLIAALDGDDRPDIAMVRVQSSYGDVAVFLNEGDGDFPDANAYDIDPDAFIGGLAFGDLDVDDDIDLVATFAYSHEAPVRLVNRGQGIFDLAEPFNSEITVTPAIGVEDFNGDGVNDIVTAGGGGVRIYLNDGNGSFGAPPLTHDPDVLLSSATRLALADLNRDETTDLVIPGGLSNEVGVLLNDGTGVLGDESLHQTGSYAGDAAIADMNGDEWPDIVVANRDGSSVSVLLNGSATASADGEPITPGVAWLDVLRPNPAGSAVSVSYQAVDGVRSRLAAYDAAGRVVAILADGDLAGGVHGLSWDLRDKSGRTVPPGMYFFKLETGTLHQTQKLVVVR